MVWTDRRETWQQRSFDARTPGDVDYARVIHSASFRRLQGKTQILNLGDSDFYRTRLTHSLEVAQIAVGLTIQLKHNLPDHDAIQYLPDRSMMQAIACTHDLGHPPFGHGGEVALNYCMREAGGFEGNGQTLRILSRLEKMSKGAGSNLTRETMLGVLKYPVSYGRAANPSIIPMLRDGTSGTPILDRKASKPPKCYLDSEQDIVDWLLQPLTLADRDVFQSFNEVPGKHQEPCHKSFACSLMDLADDISFGIHDLEDVLAMRLIAQADFEKHVTPADCAALLDYLNTEYPGDYGNDVYTGFVARLFGDGNERKHQINRVLNMVIPAVTIREKEEFVEPRLRYQAVLPEPVMAFVVAIKNLVREEVVYSPSVQHLEFKGQMMVIAVYEVMRSEPEKFLPADVLERYKEAADPLRHICDYLAGMTDAYLLRTYDRLFSPRMGSVFDKL
ncbi:dNTP triphosphohydrolase [Rhizobium leguminosarum]|uniref:anti-phage deoxyguanosine triphosphatase n=1 Tax=Rhizobium leguminosarum TaxID=384 RepID=UPI0010302915|nr:anti-phage deoxyguanosine triphosphatase [Rhizobium leguminosarum]TAU22558.1 dNTP triphosphohydrolase [Rhizobium leguminosarum]TAU42554.1 dNTP triphosphohydrolase [Rhizobium leguminosarum]